MNYTAHSEVGKIKTLFIKSVQQAFVNEVHIEKYWSVLNYQSKPGFSASLRRIRIISIHFKNEWCRNSFFS